MSGFANITPAIPADRQVIDSYAPGYFRISNTVHDRPVVVFPDRTIPWDAAAFGALTIDDFRPVIEADPPVEVLVLGSGATMGLMPSALRAALRQKGLAVDVMASPAACRTYNVLLAEGRRVAALLFPLPSA